MADDSTNNTNSIFGREPVLWLAAIQGVIACAIGFGLKWTPQQMALVLTASGSLLALVARGQVTPAKPGTVTDLKTYIGNATPDVINKAGVKIITTNKTIALLLGALLLTLTSSGALAQARDAFVREAAVETVSGAGADTSSSILSLDRFNVGPVIGATIYDFGPANVPNEFGAFVGAVGTYELTSRWNLNAYAERQFVAGNNVHPHWRYAVGPGVMLPGSNDNHQWWLAVERTWYDEANSHPVSNPAHWVARLQWSFGTPDSRGKDWSYAAARARYDIDLNVADFSAKWQPQIIGR